MPPLRLNLRLRCSLFISVVSSASALASALFVAPSTESSLSTIGSVAFFATATGSSYVPAEDAATVGVSTTGSGAGVAAGAGFFFFL